jgi:hypothetical protein
VRIAPSKNATSLLSTPGNRDFMLQAFDGQEMGVEYFSRSGSEVDHALAGRAAGPPEPVEMHGQVDKALATVSPDNPTIDHKTQVCGEDYVQYLGQMRATAGRTSTPSQTSWMALNFQTGSSSHLGVGFSVSGGYGTFSSSGSVARSSSVAVDFGQRQGWFQYYVYVSYGKYAQWCYDIYSDYAHRTIYAYYARANSGANGADLVAKDTATAANYCSPIGPKVTITKTDTAAQEFGSGVEISAYIGVDLSSRTGYSSAQILTAKNTATSQSKRICGSDDYLSGAPRNVRMIT